MTLWWLSFVDRSRPNGDQFVGACIVSIPSTITNLELGMSLAVRESHRSGCNPGGEVAGRTIAEEHALRIGREWIGVLLNHEQINEITLQVQAGE